MLFRSYLNLSGNLAFNKILPLVRINRSTIEGKEEQAAELLATFFPPLLVGIEDKGPWP